MVVVVRPGVTVYRLPDGQINLVIVPGTVPLSVIEREMLDDLRHDVIVGGDGCGQWHAWQAQWNGQAWCCPVCRRILTFPF